MAILCVAGLQILQAQQIDTITEPAGSQSFGNNITFLSNGNYVVVDAGYDEGAVPNVGAVYLYYGLNNTLISTLKGSTANDNIGSQGVTALSNGNYVVNSPNWANGTATNAGAVTWGNGSTGISGTVSSSNSLVGSKANAPLLPAWCSRSTSPCVVFFTSQPKVVMEIMTAKDSEGTPTLRKDNSGKRLFITSSLRK